MKKLSNYSRVFCFEVLAFRAGAINSGFRDTNKGIAAIPAYLMVGQI
jgi:hypothetical protein